MSQIIYAIAALAAVTLFSVSIQRAGTSGEQEMYLTESRSRMLGQARETVEQIAKLEIAFDEKTDANRVNQYAVFPFVSTEAELTSPASFGAANCTDIVSAGCLDLDDFHGIQMTEDVSGLPIVIDVEIGYVDPQTGYGSNSETYAKELTVSVSTDAIQVRGEPIKVSYTRVFAYPSVFEYAVAVESQLISDIYPR